MYDLDGRIELILDSGPTTVGVESTVVDLTCSPFQILRPGPIGPEEIARCLGGLGQLAKHEGIRARTRRKHRPARGCWPRTTRLAPRPYVLTRAMTWQNSPGQRDAGCLSLEPLPYPICRPRIIVVELPEPKTAGQQLYSCLHQLDALNLEVIVIVMPPDLPDWRHHSRPSDPGDKTSSGLRDWEADGKWQMTNGK